MQLGIVPVLSGHSGSIYQYSYNILTALYHLETEDGFILFTEDPAGLGFFGDSRDGWRIRPMEPYSVRSVLRMYMRKLARRQAPQVIWDATPFRPKVDEFDDEVEVFDPDVINYRPSQGRWFARNGADLMLFPAPTVLSFEAGIPYVTALHDLKFNLHAEYPRLLLEGEGVVYEYMIRNAARYAALILADSETGKEDLLQYCGAYGVEEDQIRVLPQVAAAYLDAEIPEAEVQSVLSRHGLIEPYLFIPAAFWPHKNHDRLVEALELLKIEYKLPVPAVLCGSKAGRIRQDRFREIADLVHDRDLERQVRLLGYVPDEEMSALYAGSRMVADLSLFGTQSAVVREAWAAGRAVVAARIRGVREQVGDAGLLVDPRSVEDIAEGIRKLWTEPDTRARLVDRGTAMHQSFQLSDFSARLAVILKEAQARMESREES